MPLVFVHGINTRETDRDYARGVAARRTMFEELVASGIAADGFPAFEVAPDIYWGDLGVGFAWQLQSLPHTRVIDALGVVDREVVH